MIKTILTAAGLSVLLTQPLLAGGAVSINWGNAGDLNGAMSTLFSDVAGATKLSAGITNVAGDGFRLDLVAVQGGSNYVLATATIGDNPNALAGPGQLFAGKFDILSVVPSNVLAGAVGAPLGVRYFNGTSQFGIISNATISVPTPNWVVPPFGAVFFEPDLTDPNYQGPQTTGGTGYYTDTATGNIPTNQIPVAICRDVTVGSCQASVTANQVNNGSSDPDGDPITFSLNQTGSFALGTNSVTLTVADNHGGTNTCQANIIVIDTTPPSITCPNHIVAQIAAGQTSAIVNFATPATSDNCGVQSVTLIPPSGSIFQLGTTPVSCRVIDNANLTNTCSFNVTVIAQLATNDRVVSLQRDVSNLRQCLGEVGLLLLANNPAELNSCVAAGNLLLANAQSPATRTALGDKTAAKLAKKVAAWVAKLGTALPDDNTKALQALLKLTSTGIKLEQLFLKLGDIYPYLVLTEVKGKTGYHGTNEVVCYHVTVFNGAGLTNCNPVTITIANFPSDLGLDVVQGPTIYSNRVDLCVTTGVDRGGAIITAIGCDQSNQVVLINTGN
ncbi:MAG: HYR domain-containing protein [Verrucomicrobiota bacterium]